MANGKKNCTVNFICSRVHFVTVLFFFSGVSSLILETVFCRLLSYTFGNTAAAVSTALAGFLGGLALGAWALGVWTERRLPSLAVYGCLEGLVAAYALLITKIFALLTSVYVFVCRQIELGPTGLVAVRFSMAMLVVLPASFLMGGTLPVLSKYVATRDALFRTTVDRLYAWNTLGAAAGTIVSTYALLPSFGLSGAIYIACAINGLIFVTASVMLRADQRDREISVDVGKKHADNDSVPGATRKLLLLGSFGTGAVALGYEVIWTHVQAFTIGNSVYAFGITLFAVLCGLGFGAHIVSKRFGEPHRWAPGLIVSQTLLGAIIFFTLPLWGKLPILLARGYVAMFMEDAIAITTVAFLGLAYAYGRIVRQKSSALLWESWARNALIMMGGVLAIALTLLFKYRQQLVFNIVTGGHSTVLFVASEFLRFLCAFSLLIVPAVLLGIAFPLLLNLCSGSADHAGSSVGSVYASNTMGAILGSVLTGFVLIPHIGSQGTLRTLATLNIVLALGFVAVLIPGRARVKASWAAAGATLVLLGWFGVSQWNPSVICNDAYVYLVGGFPVDRVLYQKEDTAGGMTSVIQNSEGRILLSNGKFQGNDSTEESSQTRFAIIPMLFARHARSALVIGLGTGQTLHTLSRFAFDRIDVAEMAPQIVEAARDWFRDVNGDVMDKDPRVHLSIADGRNFLLLSERKYDVITIEVTSIWMDGEADLYNEEFYRLCSQHLSDGGVLQQWVQLHHMPRKDLLVVLNTAARAFPHVAFFVGYGGQGVLVASRRPLTVDYNWLEAMDANPKLAPALRSIHVPSVEGLLGDIMLCEDSFRRAILTLPKISHLSPDFVSSDLHPYLEYETPKGNVHAGNTLFSNIKWLEQFRPALLPPELAIMNFPSANERNLLVGYVLAERQENQLALQYLSRVKGPAQVRADQEIARLQNLPSSGAL